MKTLKLLLPVFLVLAFSQTVFSQRLLGGKVVEIIDGKTAVVEIQSSGKLTVVLQFIETPESEQPLHQTVKEHLKKLILDKYVQVLPQGITQAQTVGKIFLGDVDVSQQMIRDGAAWYALKESGSQNSNEKQTYINTESQAKNEKRGVWGIEGLKPAWEFRAEKEKAEKEKIQAELNKQQEEAKLKSQNNIGKKLELKDYKIILPEKIPSVIYIDANTAMPNGFVVIGVGYLEDNKEKLLKAVKKPQDGDLACVGHLIPSSYVAISIAYSKLCPSSGYSNNANYITNASAYSRAVTKEIISKIILAFRMYRISGNFAEFEVKAKDAINTANQGIPFLEEGGLKENLIRASEALTDAMLVRNSRNGEYGARLSGSALIALNDKYELNDVSAYSLDREIVSAGVEYINNATREAKRLGIVQTK